MFIGHYGVGFACKRAAPRTSLGLLILAASLLDLIWPILILTGVELVRIEPGNTVVTPLDFAFYPYSHSLLLAAVGGAALGALYFWGTRYRAGAIALAVGVVSHWVLDAVVHRADLPVYPGGGRVGLGLWNSVGGTIVVEGAIFVAGVWLYATGTRAKNTTGRWTLWTLVALLSIAYVGNLTGAPPPNATAVAAVGLASWIFPLWGWWIDRNRSPNLRPDR